MTQEEKLRVLELAQAINALLGGHSVEERRVGNLLKATIKATEEGKPYPKEWNQFLLQHVRMTATWPAKPQQQWQWRWTLTGLKTPRVEEIVAEFLDWLFLSDGKPLLGVCNYCGRVYLKSRSDQKFCKPSHRQLGWRVKQRRAKKGLSTE